MLRNRTPSSRRATVFASLLLAVAAACDSDRASDPTPTSPRLPTPPPPASASWSGEWFLDGATPADNCVSETINDVAAQGFTLGLRVAVERNADQIVVRLLHAPGNEPDEGFWPLEFRGTVDGEGRVQATVPATSLGAVRRDPWLEFCSPTWAIEGGELTAVLSADGRTLSGTTTETFRALDPARPVEFTVHGRLFAVTP